MVLLCCCCAFSIHILLVRCHHSAYRNIKYSQQLERIKLQWSQCWLQNRWKRFQNPNVLWKYVPLPVFQFSHNREMCTYHRSANPLTAKCSRHVKKMLSKNSLWLKKDAGYKMDLIPTYWKERVIHLFLCWYGSTIFFHQHTRLKAWERFS